MLSRNKIILIGGGLLTVALLLAAVVFIYKRVFSEEVRGRVMVVQRNAEVKRLALIKVHAVTASEADAWRASVVNRYRQLAEKMADYVSLSASERKGIVSENDSSIDRLDRLLSAAIECRDASREFWIVDPNQPSKKNRFFERIVMPGIPSANVIEQDALHSRWDRCYEALRNSVVPELEAALDKAKARKAAELKHHDAEVHERLAQFRDELSRMLSPDSLTEIPSTVRKIYSGISDDNGDFSIRLPIGDYYLIARAERRVFDTDERYYWVRPVSVPSDESMRCLMGNNNMLGGPDKNLWTDLGELIRTQMEEK